MRGCDWAFGRPGGAALKAAGIEFVGRYYSRDPAKNLTVAEVADYLPRGIAIWPIWEAVGNAALGGAPQGQRDASDAISEARATGQPSGTVIGAAIDFDPTPAQLPAVNGYQRSFSAIVRGAGYHAGGYGPLRLLEAWLADGSIDYGVEAVAWAHGGMAVLTQVVQQLAQQTINGVTVDLDIARVPYFGQWKADTMAYRIRDARTGEVDAFDGITRRHLTPEENALFDQLGVAAWVACTPAVWDSIPVYTPPATAVDVDAVAAAVLVDLKTAGVVVFHG